MTLKKFTIRPAGWHEHFKAAHFQVSDVEVVAHTFAEACRKHTWTPDRCQLIREEPYRPGERLNERP